MDGFKYMYMYMYEVEVGAGDSFSAVKKHLLSHKYGTYLL